MLMQDMHSERRGSELATKNSGNKATCAFCGKGPHQVMAMIQGPDGIYICDECVATCAEAMMADLGMQMKPDKNGAIGWTTPEELEQNGAVQGFADDHEPTPDELLADLPTPHRLYAELSEYVVGQEAAKRALSVAVYNHYKRIGLEGTSAGNASAGDAAASDAGEVELAKSNILLLGPTGSGKTLLAQTLARTLRVPFAIADATTLTEAGYVGEDVENILLKLITAADFDIPRAEIGIIYIDEIDKIARKAENLSITRDVSGEGVQQALLKIVEGCDASVPPQGGRKHPQQELIHINTDKILFILGGAFVGLTDIIAARVGESAIGFMSDLPESKEANEASLLARVLPEDLNKYGMIPEFVGRIPVVTSLSALTEDDLVRILVEPRNALVKQYKKMFEFEQATLEFTDDALRAIAHEAVVHGTGARGLRSICERVLLDVMYDLPEQDGASTVTVRATDITGETKPEICAVAD